jgi:hypothetical protein
MTGNKNIRKCSGIKKTINLKKEIRYLSRSRVFQTVETANAWLMGR